MRASVDRKESFLRGSTVRLKERNRNEDWHRGNHPARRSAGCNTTKDSSSVQDGVRKRRSSTEKVRLPDTSSGKGGHAGWKDFVKTAIKMRHRKEGERRSLRDSMEAASSEENAEGESICKEEVLDNEADFDA